MARPSVNLNSLCAGAVVFLARVLLVLWNRLSMALAYSPNGAKVRRQLPVVSLPGCLVAIVNGVTAQKAFAWSRICGPVTRFSTVRSEIVVLNDLETIKAFLNHRDLFNRSPRWTLNGTIDLGFAVDGGKTWATRRRHSVHLLRMLGTGTSEIENIVRETYNDLQNCIAKKTGQPLNLSEFLLSSSSGIMCRLLFNCCCPLDDPHHREFTQALRYEFSSSHSGSIVSSLPPSLLALSRRLPFAEARALLKAMVRIEAFVSEHTGRVARDLSVSNSSFVNLSLLENQVPRKYNNTRILPATRKAAGYPKHTVGVSCVFSP